MHFFSLSVEVSINYHKDHHHHHGQDHASADRISRELFRYGIIRSLHSSRANNYVENDKHRNRCSPCVQVNTWFLLLNSWEKSVKETIVPDLHHVFSSLQLQSGQAI